VKSDFQITRVGFIVFYQEVAKREGWTLPAFQQKGRGGEQDRDFSCDDKEEKGGEMSDYLLSGNVRVKGV